MVSGGSSPEGHILFVGRESFHSGLAGVALTGNLAVDTIVAQGCRPIGVPMFVTQCRENLLQELDGRPPSEVLQELYPALEPRDQELFRNSLFLGMVMKEARQNYGRGDFLIRNIVGMDRETGALSIGATLKENWVVQFHLRDAQASADDLEDLLSRYAGDPPQPSPQGALLFSCLGRGVYLYGEPDHDTLLFRRHLPGIPMGGFFCNGEIGPVQGKTYLHGYTSSFGIFRPRS